MSAIRSRILLSCTACGAGSKVPVEWVDMEEMAAACPSCGRSERLDPKAQAQLIGSLRIAAGHTAEKVQTAIAALDSALGPHQDN
jgi:hypothetical protein